MTSASKAKGDNAERELVTQLRALGVECERAYGAGRPDDEGDLDLDGVLAQVKSYGHWDTALLSSLRWLSEHEADDRYRVAFVKVPRRRLGPFVVAMELEDWAALYRAAVRP